MIQLNSFEERKIVDEALNTENQKQIAILFDMLKPELTVDGDHWVCLWGHLPEKTCIVGFGASPAEAIASWARDYYKPLKQ